MTILLKLAVGVVFCCSLTASATTVTDARMGTWLFSHTNGTGIIQSGDYRVSITQTTIFTRFRLSRQVVWQVHRMEPSSSIS